MAHAATVTIAPAGPEDVPALSSALARAFHDDPVFRWVVPDPVQRRAQLPSVFAAFAALYLPYEETYQAGGGMGAALWAPAGSEPPSEEQLETFRESLAAALGEDAERAAKLDAILDQYHPDEPSFYLQFMGVVPEYQGQGLGSRLLTEVLPRCDTAGTPAYLEATSPHNRRLYQRHSFNTLAEIDLPDGPPLWAMWREPVT